ncbi:MAG: homoserine dehydrogenase [Rhodoferax sp.]|nr:MAG: homoserine dehydrogenase [Rhodoferax sp.]
MYQDPLHASQYGGANPQLAAPLRVGLLGLGTVGGGTYAVLQRNAALIAARAGRRIEVRRVAVRNLARARSVLGEAVGHGIQLSDDALSVVQAPDIDVVVETIGGTGTARSLVLQAIAHGKHVVTANKALLAEHGTEIFAAAQAHGVVVAYEGAVAVSIPIIKALREGLSANRIEWVAGIINGTSNFILSAMRDEGLSFADALAQAQALGYAEADPALDVQGGDAAHKLSLLAANAFGTPPLFAQVQVQGIDKLDALDVEFARQLGYSVKLLGIAKRCGPALELRVHPTLLPHNHLLAQVHGSMNAVMVKSDAAGTTLYYGAGAGAEQTGSAVVADLVDLARSQCVAPTQRVPALAFQPSALAALPVRSSDETSSAFYLRLDLERADTTVPRVLQQLAQDGVCVEHMQLFEHPGDAALHCLVLRTAPLCLGNLHAALETLQAWPTVLGFASVLRIEMLD